MRRTRKDGVVAALIAGCASLAAAGAAAQDPATTVTVTGPSRMAVSPPLSDLPAAAAVHAPAQTRTLPPPKPLPARGAGPGSASAAPRAVQAQAGPDVGIQPGTSFGGISDTGYIPPDPNIAVGRTYIVQVVNTAVAVFDKAGTIVSGPTNLGSLWSALGGACAASDAGDPIVQYDNLADHGGGRWIITQLGSISGPYSECIAVSQTSDPTGAYNLYAYSFGFYLNDYPKFGVWPTQSNSAYFASYNLFTGGGVNLVGADLCAYDRAKMLAGRPANQICFQVSNDGGFLPADLDGATPPADGTPGYFLNFNTLSSLRLYELQPDFASPSNSTLTLASPDIAVAPFGEACGGGICIPQPGTGQRLDSLGDRLMYRLAYRVFGDHAAMVVNHAVGVGPSVGVRWYELRSTSNPSSPFSLFQQGTFAPDAAYRWMGSAATDGAGDIALGYSLSGPSIYPSIAVTARTPAMASGTMGSETMLVSGLGSQGGCSPQDNYCDRWGDYTALRIDPSDDKTFWYTNEYYANTSAGGWSTAIGSFTISTASPVVHITRDFNADGRSDILWQNDNGDGAVWLMNGTSAIAGADLGNFGSSWHIITSGDLGGDGHADILWQHDSGEAAVWLMNGTTAVGGGVIAEPGPSWHIITTGDLNGDGRSDILWQNDSGAAAVWLMNGTTIIGSSGLGNPGPSWHIKAAADFGGDGHADILWQNDNGAAAIWLMNGATYLGAVNLGNPGSSWHIKGVGDFNHDGHPDILWQNDSGAAVVWLMNGTALISGGVIAEPGPSWHVITAGDYNGDGYADVLWQHDSGETVIWLMNGTTVIGSGVIATPGSSWHAIGG